MAVFDLRLLRLRYEGWGGGGVHSSISCLWRRNRPFCDASCYETISKSWDNRRGAFYFKFVDSSSCDLQRDHGEIHTAKVREKGAAAGQALFRGVQLAIFYSEYAHCSVEEDIHNSLGIGSEKCFGRRVVKSWRLPRRGTQPETALGGLESRHKLRYRDTFVRAWGLILGIEQTANTSPQRMLSIRRTTSQI